MQNDRGYSLPTICRGIYLFRSIFCMEFAIMMNPGDWYRYVAFNGPRVDRTPSSIRCGITSSAVAYRAKETAPQVLSLLLSTQSIQSLWLERAHEETAKAAKTSPHHRQHHEGLNGPSPTRIDFEDRCSAVAAAGFRLRAFRTQLLPHPRIRSLSTSSSLPHR